MPTIVVPYRGDSKRRLPAPIRAAAAVAMLGDVVEAALSVGPVLVVTDDATVVPPGAEWVSDPGGGLGAAVSAALALVEGHALVLNADLPAATPDAIRELAAAGLALVEARRRDDERALAAGSGRCSRRSTDRGVPLASASMLPSRPCGSRSSRPMSTPARIWSGWRCRLAGARARSSPFPREARPALRGSRGSALRARPAVMPSRRAS